MGLRQNVLFALILVAPLSALAEQNSKGGPVQSLAEGLKRVVRSQADSFARQQQIRSFQSALAKGEISEARRLMKNNNLSVNDADFFALLKSKNGFTGAKFVVENGLSEAVILESAKQAASSCMFSSLFRALLLARHSGSMVHEVASKTLDSVKSMPLKNLRCGPTEKLLNGEYYELSEFEVASVARTDDERFLYERQKLQREMDSDSNLSTAD